MQAKLPDVNGAIVRHRNAVMIAYDTKDYQKAAISLNAIISLLPDDYKVTINTDAYYNAIAAKQTIACRYCTDIIADPEDKSKKGVTVPKSFMIDIIHPYSLRLSSLDSLIMHKDTMKVWECPNCKMVQPLQGSIKKMIKYQKPYYLGIIPDPPIRHGLYDRVGFAHRFVQWFDIALQEIESKIGLYRRDYMAQRETEGLEKYADFFKEEDQDEQS